MTVTMKMTTANFFETLKGLQKMMWLPKLKDKNSLFIFQHHMFSC